MPIYLWIIVFIFCILLIIFFMPISIRIQIKKDQRDDRIALTFKTLFGLVNYKMELPIIDWIISPKQEPILEIDTKTKADMAPNPKTKKKNFLDLKEIDHYQKRFSNFFERYYKVLLYISKKIVLKSFQWKTILGTGDAAITGTIIGVVWAVKGILVSILQNHIRCEDIDILVNPSFQEQRFITNLDSIIHVKTGHIIIAALKLGIVFIIKGGEGNGSSSN
ncbi:hypothetical protein Gferi_00135 [Geosporobacter ferrireducens]|uniref:DUF2953 domain-containing protein n=1 Tax=Geosporobacter ferrireducens TaxID=1424294 RepID=A0A1D8GB34_9FIRM|nr:hypothetical protein Gferi_00135 [Geosporobacter ferrireducens]